MRSLWGVIKSWGWSLYDGISALMKRPQGVPPRLPPYRDTHSVYRSKEGPHSNRLAPDVRPSASRAIRSKFLLSISHKRSVVFCIVSQTD